MYTLGHVGAALLVYAPLAGTLSGLGEPALGALGLGIAAGCATIPDLDERLPLPHRGPTHTVWFVLCAGLLGTVLGWIAGVVLGAPGVVSAVVGTAVVLSLLSHLLADSLTPMGIRPFAPLSEFHHSFRVVRAKNRRANLALFGSGLVAVGLWITTAV